MNEINPDPKEILLEERLEKYWNDKEFWNTQMVIGCDIEIGGICKNCENIDVRLVRYDHKCKKNIPIYIKHEDIIYFPDSCRYHKPIFKGDKIE